MARHLCGWEPKSGDFRSIECRVGDAKAQDNDENGEELGEASVCEFTPLDGAGGKVECISVGRGAISLL
jgi:hypothetical protein